MEIRHVSDSVAIYSDGQRLQVIHDLGDEFVIDIAVNVDKIYNIDTLVAVEISDIKPSFRVSGFCAKSEEDMHRLRWAISQFGVFDTYLVDNQEDLEEWLKEIGGNDE